MRKRTILSIILLFVLITSNSFAYSSRKKYFSRPQVGIWYGPITPMWETSTEEEVDTTLGGGVFFRYNLPSPYWKVGLEASYQPYESEDTINEINLIPVYGNILFLLPFRMPLRIQLKAGAGACRVHVEPDDQRQWDPLFTTGVEVSFPAGKMLNVALRLDYLLVYEEHIDGADRNGHFFNAGISLYFNIGL